MAPLVWLITGTSSGFGAQLVKLALARGDKVIATSRNASKLGDLAELGAYTVSLDVISDDTSVKAAVDSAVKEFGRIDILVNNAGYILEGAVEACSAEEVQAHYECNVFGALRMIRAVLPYMRAQKSGVIGNIGSIAGWQGGAGFGLYNSVKFALAGITEAAKEELKPLGIDVTIIEPGYFRTNFLSSGNRTQAAKKIADYDQLERQLKGALDAANQNQPGDPVKGCQVMVDALSKSGQFAGVENLPGRLTLGSDAAVFVSQKLKSLTQQHEQWTHVTSKTDHDDVKKA